jgi:hypothetical protein
MAEIALTTGPVTRAIAAMRSEPSRLTVVPFKKPPASRKPKAPLSGRIGDLIKNADRVADMVERLQRAIQDDDRFVFKALINTTLVEARYTASLAQQMASVLSA